MKTRRNRIYRMKKQARKHFAAEASRWYRDEAWAAQFWRIAHPDLVRQLIHMDCTK